MVALSPVVPQGTSNLTPPAIWYSIRARRRSSSTAPFDVNGVTSAVAQPRNQSTFIVMIIYPFLWSGKLQFVDDRRVLFPIYERSSRRAHLPYLVTTYFRSCES